MHHAKGMPPEKGALITNQHNDSCHSIERPSASIDLDIISQLGYDAKK